MREPRLHISDTLSLPLDFVTCTQAILAIKRVGKSYTASVQAEELLKAGQQIVAIDVTGAWYGLRSNAAGDGPGFPVVIFGGDHGDVALEEGAGEVLAEAIVTERFSAIIDISLFRKGQAQRFLAVFFEALYRRNREAMHVFMDEADFYAPQKPFGEEARTLGAVNDIVRRGGIRGIGCTLITQRASVLNKDVLTQAGIVTALRVSHPRDMAAILEWVDVHSSRADAQAMMTALPSLPIGTAFVWAPGWPTEKGIFERIQIRQRETFNSGATPKAGQVAKQPKVMAKLDIDKLGEQIASTVKRQRDNDPSELKRTIADLRKQLAAASGKIDESAINEALVKRQAEYDKFLGLIRRENDRLRDCLIRSAEAMIDVAKQPQADTPHWSNPMLPRSSKATLNRDDRFPEKSKTQPQPKEKAESNGDLSRPQMNILSALAQFMAIDRTVVPKKWVAVLAGASHTSSAFSNNLSALRTGGYIEYPSPGDLMLTSNGIAAAPSVEPPANAREMLARCKEIVSRPQAAILDALHNAYPNELERSQVADLSEASATSSAFSNNLSALHSAGMIEYPSRGTAKLAGWVMLKH